jgi:hypothetical protein
LQRNADRERDNCEADLESVQGWVLHDEWGPLKPEIERYVIGRSNSKAKLLLSEILFW